MDNFTYSDSVTFFKFVVAELICACVKEPLSDTNIIELVGITVLLLFDLWSFKDINSFVLLRFKEVSFGVFVTIKEG